jgi:putative nucleotidyltransferase with HDIG domain
MPVLTISTGPARGRVFEVPDEAQSIGREGDIQILDTAASRKHAEIFTLGGMHVIRDLDSRNGTFVNDMRIDEEIVLHPGDRIRIGSSTLVFGQANDAEDAIKFVQDTVPGSSTVEIKLGERAAVMVGGPKSGSTMDRLFTMYEVSRALGSENTLQGVIDKVLSVTMTAVKPTYCYIFIRDEASGNLVPRAWRDPQRLQRREVSRSIVNRAMKLRHSILTADAGADERFDQSESVVIGEIRSVICAPLIARNRINGVLYMGRDAGAKTFDDADLELATAVAFQSGIALENVVAHMEHRDEMAALIKGTMGAAELRSTGTRGHSERVAAYAGAIADQLGLSKQELDDAVLAALLHDVGKVEVTEHCRMAVSAELGVSVQQQYCHAYLGAKLLEEVPGLTSAIPGVKYHHERLDGFGGPEGLSGEGIPLIARIVAVANRFDHLATDPVSGGQPLPISKAIEAVDQPGEGLDDAVVQALVQAQTTGTGIQLPKLVLQDFC